MIRPQDLDLPAAVSAELADIEKYFDAAIAAGVQRLANCQAVRVQMPRRGWSRDNVEAVLSKFREHWSISRSRSVIQFSPLQQPPQEKP